VDPPSYASHMESVVPKAATDSALLLDAQREDVKPPRVRGTTLQAG
jgi:hypothetical protein